jgi:hypothetical protein
MIVIWLVIAALLYFPFKRWVATDKAPIISALLWPLLIVFFIVGLPLIALLEKIRGKHGN